jgi:ethanolamine utilization protein EutQ (cupin superfamily)
VQHGDHVDYVVEGHLHHQHDGHCDHHGPHPG